MQASTKDNLDFGRCVQVMNLDVLRVTMYLFLS